MATIKMKSIDPTLSNDEINELTDAEKLVAHFDDDSPLMTEEMLSQFHSINSVNISLSPSDIKIVKSLGSNYRTVLSKLLSLALSDDDMIKRCI